MAASHSACYGKHAPLSAERCSHTGQQLSAVSACRDIKPENLFLTSTGALRVGDFGLALNFQQEAARSRVGTLDYMAPEVGTGVLQGNTDTSWCAAPPVGGLGEIPRTLQPHQSVAMMITYTWVEARACCGMTPAPAEGCAALNFPCTQRYVLDCCWKLQTAAGDVTAYAR